MPFKGSVNLVWDLGFMLTLVGYLWLGFGAVNNRGISTGFIIQFLTAY